MDSRTDSTDGRLQSNSESVTNFDRGSAARYASAQYRSSRRPPPCIVDARRGRFVQAVRRRLCGGRHRGGPVAGNAASKKPPRPENRMSMREIRSILNPKPSRWPSPYQELRESNPSLEMDDARRSLYARANEYLKMEEKDLQLREWVRKEMETKGYVEMDDDWVRRRAEASAIMEETMKKARALLLNEDDDEETMKKMRALLTYDTEEEDDDDENNYDGDDEF
ncbi:hypothetical protein HU200_034585 [Digitaria exilis]|uniref:Uncharacterized protein n=1 Tax=Digitaria exilis TaxID=1010633 RepID=A0A835BVE6_9POAL|nr:hypothetical protein HU200_034585 [Digitaria exilis]